MLDEKMRAYFESLPTEEARQPIIDTGRKGMPLTRIPEGLDFTKTISGTVYTVRSHFDPDANECVFGKINRLIFGDSSLKEYEP